MVNIGKINQERLSRMGDYGFQDDEPSEGIFGFRLELEEKNSYLVSAREALGFRQKDVTEEIGLPQTSLSSYENMIRYPSKEAQNMICSFYRDKGQFMLEEEVFPEELKSMGNIQRRFRLFNNK